MGEKKSATDSQIMNNKKRQRLRLLNPLDLIICVIDLVSESKKICESVAFFKRSIIALLLGYSFVNKVTMF